MPEVTRKIAARRGYMAIKIRDRGTVPRNMRKNFNAASKLAWKDTATYFHAELREKRFTPEHAKEANYTKRRGQNIPRGDKTFRRFYYGRKLTSRLGGGIGRADPLVKSGDTKRAVRSASITSTSKGGRARYAGARVFNYKNPTSRVDMSAEFRRITDPEIKELADHYDSNLDHRLAEIDR